MIGAVDRIRTFLSNASLSHYDLVLAVIPSAFVLAVLLGHLLSVPPRIAFAGAAAVAAMAMIDGLFRNPPESSAG